MYSIHGSESLIKLTILLAIISWLIPSGIKNNERLDWPYIRTLLAVIVDSGRLKGKLHSSHPLLPRPPPPWYHRTIAINSRADRCLSLIILDKSVSWLYSNISLFCAIFPNRYRLYVLGILRPLDPHRSHPRKSRAIADDHLYSPGITVYPASQHMVSAWTFRDKQTDRMLCSGVFALFLAFVDAATVPKPLLLQPIPRNVTQPGLSNRNASTT